MLEIWHIDYPEAGDDPFFEAIPPTPETLDDVWAIIRQRWGLRVGFIHNSCPIDAIKEFPWLT